MVPKLTGIDTVGVKGDGRALTFLRMTGYAHVRTLLTAIEVDLDAADRVGPEFSETEIRRFSNAASVGDDGTCCG